MRKNNSTVGDRVKYCRTLAKLTRPELKRRHKFSTSTLQAIEDNVINPSDEKIKELLKIFKDENVLVSFQWLKSGIGETPTEFKSTNIVLHESNYVNNIQVYDSIQLIKLEENHISKLYPNVFYGTCDVFDMEPVISFNDRVAGIPCDLENIDSLVEVLCIIKTKEDIYIKLVLKVNEDKSINIIGLNQKKADKNFYITNVIPILIAPIFRIRKNPDDFIFPRGLK